MPAGSTGGGTLLFKGRLDPRRGLHSLSVRVNFLDTDGKIIGSKSIYSPGAGRGAAKSELEQTFEVPADEVSVAFSRIAREKHPLLLN